MVMAGSGDQVTYAQLDARSRRLVHVLHRAGLTEDSTVAMIAENRIEW